MRIHIFSSISFTWEPCSASSWTCWCHPRLPMRNIRFFGEKRYSQFDVFSIQVPKDPPQIVSPTRGQQAGDRTIFVQEEPPDLPRMTKILATCVDKPGDSCFGIFSTLERRWYCVGGLSSASFLVISQQKSFSKLTILVLWTPHMHLSHL